ncbi:hypothetical protein SAY87_007733 [Trapa incisa]|uniref:Uncharacterized protein n=1 Tax=Trapa incisa TaxID=236973 RepID=A0AAN7KFJ0_9MYRT|nr:hypothetical protein SAY87_007733 [Trapa incisa]
MTKESEDNEWEGEEICSSKSPSTINNKLMEEFHAAGKVSQSLWNLEGDPCEIRKATKRLMASPPDEAGSESPKFHSWLPDDATQKLRPDSTSYLPPSSLSGEMLEENLHSQELSHSRFNL